MDLNGVESVAVNVLNLSWCTLGSYRSSSCKFFFFPQILHAVYANPATRSAPPTPPTTPPMVFFALSLKPELPLPPLSDKVVGSTAVVVGMTVELVRVASMVLPSLVVVKTVVKSTVALVATLVRDDRVEVLIAEEETSVVVADPAESVGVNVEVEKTVDSDCDCVGVTAMVEVSSVMEARVVSDVRVVVVVEPSSELVVFEDCRLNNAMASSRGSAAANDAKKMAKIVKRMT